jgi:hypothetical protein
MQQVPQVLTDTALRAQIFTRIDALGMKLGVAASHIWGVLIRQSYADAAENFAWAGAMALLFAGMYTLSRWGLSGYKKNSYWDDAECASAWIGATLALGAALIFVACVTAGLKEIINPEFYAWSAVTAWFRASK